MRPIEPIHVETTDRGTRETHPAFAVAIVGRGHGTSRPLFQSDLQHNQTITLSIHRAERGRELNRDWVHPTAQIIEMEMSLAQWGALVSSVGVGSGVPVTLRVTESDPLVSDLPYEPRIAANLAEVEGSVEKLIADASKQLDVLTEAIEQKQGAKAIRDALRNLRAILDNAPANAKHAVSSMVRAAESVVSQARSDIEAHVLNAAQATGLDAPIHVPSALAIDGGQE